MVWSILCPHPKCSNRYEIDVDELNTDHKIVTESCDGCEGQVRIKPNSPLAAADSEEVSVQVRYEYELEDSDIVPFEQYGAVYKKQDLVK